jgi:hypothetical protein
MVSSNEASREVQTSSTLPAILNKKSQQFSTDQMKRLLALIENNAQAQALQRETTMNVLLRLELLESTVRGGDTTRRSLNRRNSDLNNTQDKTFEGNVSKILGTTDSEHDFLAVMSKEKSSSALRKRSINQSPIFVDPQGARAAFKVNDLSMYASSVRHKKHRSIAPTLLQSVDTAAEEITKFKQSKRFN